jgi:hypothetical protein
MKSVNGSGEGGRFLDVCVSATCGVPSNKNATGDLQDVGDLLQPARPHTVRALLVFLHLLERKVEFISQIGLAHIQHDSAHSRLTTCLLMGLEDFFAII